MFWAERRASAKALRQNEQTHLRGQLAGRCDSSLVHHRKGPERKAEEARAGRSALDPWTDGFILSVMFSHRNLKIWEWMRSLRVCAE